jgi:8-oxo-dGTP pyrophosphatase MutT (NUDIX family)
MKRTQVECTSLYGEKIMIPVNKLELRPAAYGFVVNDGKLLVVQMKRTGKFWFPGGGLDKGETLEECVKREVWEETGIRVEVIELLHFMEIFFYYNPEDHAFHNFSFFYLCRPLSLETTDENVTPDEETVNAQWVEMSEIASRSNSQVAEVLEVYRRKQVCMD